MRPVFKSIIACRATAPSRASSADWKFLERSSRWNFTQFLPPASAVFEMIGFGTFSPLICLYSLGRRIGANRFFACTCRLREQSWTNEDHHSLAFRGPRAFARDRSATDLPHDRMGLAEWWIKARTGVDQSSDSAWPSRRYRGASALPGCAGPVDGFRSASHRGNDDRRSHPARCGYISVTWWPDR
jgi:hypothetical protein